MTGGALAAIAALGELPHVGIFVTVHACGELQRLLEIAACVALAASDCGVLGLQRVLGSSVVEVLADRDRGNALPSRSVVAGLAALGEAAAMRIGVAIGALSECDAGISGLTLRPGSMTFLAGHVGVQASQGIAGPGVIEFLDVHRLPVVVVMTLEAVGSQAALMLILVAGNARLR